MSPSYIKKKSDQLLIFGFALLPHVDLKWPDSTNTVNEAASSFLSSTSVDISKCGKLGFIHYHYYY